MVMKAIVVPLVSKVQPDALFMVNQVIKVFLEFLVNLVRKVKKEIRQLSLKLTWARLE